MKIVVVGAVAAGLKASAKARRCDPVAEITVVDKGEIISYGACGMPYYVSGEVKELDELLKTPAGIVRGPAFFKGAKDINVLTGTLVTAIDRTARTITAKRLSDGTDTSIPYDKLVLATGASPFKPYIPGMELTNIFQFWHPDDAKNVRQQISDKKIKNAVVVGAGLVGIEMAEALAKQGIGVAVLEMKDQILPQMLDAEVAKIAEKHMREQGVELFTGEKVIRFNGEDTVAAVQTENRVLPADLVIMSMGVRPNVELAKAAGLEIGPTGAIAVDENMCTSDPDIYAGGDCVENTNIVSGKKVYAPMGSTANKHGRIIGENLCGGNSKFRGVLGSGVVRIFNLNAGKTGLTERDAKELGYDYLSVIVAGHDKPHYMPGAKVVTVKLIIEANSTKVLGAQAIGEGEVAKRIDVVAAVLTFGGTLDSLFEIDLTYAPPYNSPIDNVAVAANAMMNKLSGSLKGISSLDAQRMLSDEKVVFLDVRTPAECEQIRLANCKNIKYIPLGQLRSRSGELAKDDEVVAFCKISLRGYEAQGILEGQGFKNVKVLEGGIVAWPFECEK